MSGKRNRGLLFPLPTIEGEINARLTGNRVAIGRKIKGPPGEGVSEPLPWVEFQAAVVGFGDPSGNTRGPGRRRRYRPRRAERGFVARRTVEDSRTEGRWESRPWLETEHIGIRVERQSVLLTTKSRPAGVY